MGRTDFSTIIPSLAPEANDLALDRLLSPTRHFKHPDDVLRDGTLDVGEKRAILSSWASDACAVESMPALRQPPGARRPVSFDAVMDALRFGAIDDVGIGVVEDQRAPAVRLDANDAV